MDLLNGQLGSSIWLARAKIAIHSPLYAALLQQVRRRALVDMVAVAYNIHALTLIAASASTGAGEVAGPGVAGTEVADTEVADTVAVDIEVAETGPVDTEVADTAAADTARPAADTVATQVE